MSTPSDLKDKIAQCKILLVGAGGIGCEVLKNLGLSGFSRIDAIDLDTIDVSNLNRQFLFNKSNVGQSKSKVAIDITKREYSSLKPEDLSYNYMHKSIMSSEYDVDFYKQYTFVINALDNRAARSHVNRMCLAAQIPLLESGTAGYTGQCKLIKNDLTSCYECDGIQKEGRTYATCTIRNTPSQPIHCIVWAKHLFHQLFGEEDPDNDVSPQIETSEIISTREWASRNEYDPDKLIEKLFNEDIRYLLTMEALWEKRAKPKLLESFLSDINEETSKNGAQMDNQRVWSLQECIDVFHECTKEIYQRMKSTGFQYWDKDDEVALRFVVAASNLRSKCFDIERKSPFDVKSLAGNIVPAISSTNSIVGGLLVLQAMRLLKSMPIGEDYWKLEDSERNKLIKDAGRLTYLNFTSLTRKNLIASYECPPPVPTCLACAKGQRPEVEIHLSMSNTTLSDFIDKIILGTFHFVCPDVCLESDTTILIYSEDCDNDTKKRKLTEIPHVVVPKTRLLVMDLLQDKEIVFVLIDEEEIDEEKYKNFFYATREGKEVIS